MKLNIISDIHSEFLDPKDRAGYVERFVNKDCLNVLAGDIWGEPKKPINPNILYVPGNHEFYRFGYVLDTETNFVKEINGIKFVCSTLFSDIKPNESYDISKAITDFKFVLPDVYQRLYKKAYKFLLNNIEKDCIVVTHFCPSYQSIAEQYKNSKVNSFFASNLDRLILDKKPKLWIHGHTHTAFDYFIGQTRIICNPLGYPNESVYKKVLVEV